MNNLIRRITGKDNRVEADRNKIVEVHEQTLEKFKDSAEMLWTTLANVSGGDWSIQPEAWQAAAQKWRDDYLKSLSELIMELKE
jgi:hypothetical protein